MQVTEQEKWFLEFCRNLWYGDIEIKVVKAEPVEITQAIKKIRRGDP